MDRSFPACLPPLITLNVGTGSVYAPIPPRYWYNGTSSESEAAFATARDTPNIALAPSLDLFSVPSSSIIRLSIPLWFLTSMPITLRVRIVFTLCTAVSTPLPLYRLSLSRNSSASCTPVDAPDGTLALPKPNSVHTSTSTVGFPRESSISLAFICSIVYGKISPEINKAYRYLIVAPNPCKTTQI